MVTILDIAKEAGVSHGTVSNVLNGKGNVSAKRIKLVEDAAKKLGYNINNKAKLLRTGETNIIAVVIPSYDNSEYVRMYRGIEKVLSEHGYKAHLYLTNDLESQEKKIIYDIAKERAIAVITVSILACAKDYYEILSLPKERVIFIDRKPEKAKIYASFDYYLAGVEVAKDITMKKHSKVGFFLGGKDEKNQCDFLMGLKSYLKVNEEDVFYASVNQEYNQAFELIGTKDYEIIITTNAKKSLLLNRAAHYGSVSKTPEILSVTSEAVLDLPNLIKYLMNYYEMGMKSAENLLNFLNSNEKMKSLNIYKNIGFEQNNLKYLDDKNLKLLTIKTPTAEAIIKIAPDFKKRTGIELHVNMVTYEEFYNTVNTDEVQNYDLVRLDVALLPWYGKDLYRPLNNLSNEVDELLASIAEHYYDKYVSLNEIPYTIPFDPSVQMLFYRKDVFNNQLVKRTYFEEKKKNLEIPKTYDEFVEIAEFISSTKIPFEKVRYGTSVNLGGPIIVAAEFLTCYYALGGKFSFSEGKVQIDIELGSLALEQYLGLIEASKKENTMWWQQSIESFRQGKTAMIIGFMNYLSKVAQSEIGPLVGATHVPGNRPLLGGGVIGITKETMQLNEAVQFLKWVNQREIAKQITLLGGISSNHQLGTEETINQKYPWLVETQEMTKHGIRENLNDLDEPINLSLVEELIGTTIKSSFQENWVAKEIIEKINHQILQMDNYI